MKDVPEGAEYLVNSVPSTYLNCRGNIEHHFALTLIITRYHYKKDFMDDVRHVFPQKISHCLRFPMYHGSSNINISAHQEGVTGAPIIAL